MRPSETAALRAEVGERTRGKLWDSHPAQGCADAQRCGETLEAGLCRPPCGPPRTRRGAPASCHAEGHRDSHTSELFVVLAVALGRARRGFGAADDEPRWWAAPSGVSGRTTQVIAKLLQEMSVFRRHPWPKSSSTRSSR